MARREIQVFNMSFLDMMTNFLGAVIILFLLAAQNVAKAPGVIRKFEASYDENRLTIHSQVAGVNLGDTLMLIVKDNKELFKTPELASVNNNYRHEYSERRYIDTTGLWRSKLPANQQPEAILIESMTSSPCNNANTPDKAEDDTYTAVLKIVKLGKPGTNCLVDGKSFAYNAAITIGPYKMSDGKKRIQIRDGADAALSKTLELNPPPPCQNTAPPPPPPPPAAPRVPGKINFYVSWDDPEDKVNIYVRKGRKWVYGGRPRDESIGEFSELSGQNGPLRRENTNVETIRQMGQAIPGVYEIYAHLRENRRRSGKEVPISLWLINEKFPYESREFRFNLAPTEENPKSGGGKLLKTVEITTEGKFIIR